MVLFSLSSLSPAKVLSSPRFTSETVGKNSAEQLRVSRFGTLWRKARPPAGVVAQGIPAGAGAEAASQFALYENGDGMISHHCDIRNIRSPLEKVLERGTFERWRFGARL